QVGRGRLGELPTADRCRRLAIAGQGGEAAAVLGGGPVPVAAGHRLVHPDRPAPGAQAPDQGLGDPALAYAGVGPRHRKSAINAWWMRASGHSLYRTPSTLASPSPSPSPRRPPEP